MAKRKPKREEEAKEEKYEFTPPSFKEDEFYKKEIRNSKFSLLVLAFALAGGVLSFAVLMFFGLAAGFGAGLVMGLGIVAIPKILKSSYSDFKWTVYFWNSATYFAWIIAIMLIASNPPVMDFTAPTVTAFNWSFSGENVTTDWHGAGTVIYLGGANLSREVQFRVRAVDNADKNLKVFIEVGNQPETRMNASSNGYTFTHRCVLSTQGIAPTDIDGVSEYRISVRIRTDDSGSDTWFGSDEVHEAAEVFTAKVRTGDKA